MFSTIALGVLYVFLSKKMETKTLQIRMLTKQNRELTTKVNTLTKSYDTLKVSYLALPSITGEIIASCPLFLSPIYNSPILRTLPSSAKVELLDLIEIQDTLWYEVKMISNESFNLKGFIKKEFIHELQCLDTTIVCR